MMTRKEYYSQPMPLGWKIWWWSFGIAWITWQYVSLYLYFPWRLAGEMLNIRLGW